MYIMSAATGKPVAEVVRELKINDHTLYGWVKKFADEPEVIAAQAFGDKSRVQLA